MANVLIFNLCLALVLSGVESCFIPDSLYIIVPRTIQTGRKITTVEVADCDTNSMIFTLSDPNFQIRQNGAIEAVRPVSVSGTGRTFSVWARDNNGPESEMVVHLVHSAIQGKKSPSNYLKRVKRRWSPPPFNILENDKGPYPKAIEKIVSDSEAQHDVYYTISGPGVNQHPVGVFSLNRETGMLTIHKPVDREEFPRFKLTTRVFNKITNEETDLPLPIQIEVDDVNDNAPTFKDPLQFTVLELSPAGSIVGKVDADDIDQGGSLHVKIKYTLEDGLNRFAIHPVTGVITTTTNTLDREVKDKYLVIVKIKDMDGATTGMSNTGTATITLADINDNPPTFTETSYAVTVPENGKETLILRIPIEDKDLINTPNWISKFVIAEGNEQGNFRIDTDPNTNEGLLYVSKPLDYEQNKNVKLEIMARNVADLAGTTSTWVSIPVDVTVVNEDEGPAFTAPTVRYNVKENTANGTLIGSYIARDPETKSSNGIKYYKTTDPASWINVDRDNGELRVANTIDRESHYVHDGIYNITVKAVDASLKTGIGTVIIVVEDVNDHMPTFPTSEMVVCEQVGQLGSVLVVAEDHDQSPFSSPFSFSLPKDNDGKWSLTKYNDTAATLKHVKDLPTGIYEVPLHVTDLQGSGKTQVAQVRICECKNGACLDKDHSVSLGPLGILALLLPLLLLLLLGLLLAIFCTTKRKNIELEDEGNSGGILIKSNTEAPGEEVDSSLITIPINGGEVTKGSYQQDFGTAGGAWTGNGGLQEEAIYTKNVQGDMQDFYTTRYEQYGQQQGLGSGLGSGQGSGMAFDSRLHTQDSTFLHNWQTNGRYLDQKLDFFGTEEDGRYADDVIHSYGFEGVGSAAGSVGCCSDFGDNDNLDFVNTLGPKFKTLSEVCRKT
ncbi:desmocollin 2 like isoform X2 [Trematomus bernacchii]|uniref:desmocollin 2 like isoform X2 n=1 Tax=Trematomus bernacchii TaxID=40690 RepID=UPI00146CF690|nr:desmocollin 2 like isoform X2 [Trematomus bernacchii]